MGERRLTKEEELRMQLAQQRFDITGIIGPPGTLGGAVIETGRLRNPPVQYQIDLLHTAQLNYNQQNALRIELRAAAEDGERAVINRGRSMRDIIRLLRQAARQDKQTFLAYNQLRAIELRIHIELLRADIQYCVEHKLGHHSEDRELIYFNEKLTQIEDAIRHIENSRAQWADPNSKMIITPRGFSSKPTIAAGRNVMADAARLAVGWAHAPIAVLIPDRPAAAAAPEYPQPARHTAIHPEVNRTILGTLRMEPATILEITEEEIGGPRLPQRGGWVPNNINVFLSARAADIYRTHNMNHLLIQAVRRFVRDRTAQVLTNLVSGHQLFLFQLSAAGSRQTGMPIQNSVIILTVEEIMLQMRLNEQTRTIVVPRAGTPASIIYEEIRRATE